MTSAIPPELAGRLAQECRAAASSLLRLQETLGLATPDLDMSDRMVKDLQSLDTVAQTMDDLGAVFRAIAALDPAVGRPGVTSAALLASVSQTSLRERLTGSVERDEKGDVDLF